MENESIPRIEVVILHCPHCTRKFIAGELAPDGRRAIPLAPETLRRVKRALSEHDEREFRFTELTRYCQGPR